MRAIDEDEGRADVLRTNFERVEGADFGVLVGPPCGRQPDRPVIGEIAARIVDEVTEAGAARQADVARYRQLSIKFNRILESAAKNRGQ